MRGKATSPQHEFWRYRITPAYAGKREDHARSRERAKDHPRLCGEKETIKVGQVTGTGSPPPMRGKGREESCVVSE